MKKHLGLKLRIAGIVTARAKKLFSLIKRNVASNEEKTIPMIWYKLNTDNDWHIVTAQKDTNGEYCKFYISNAKFEELVNVKYLYKCKHEDSWIW